MKLRDWINFNFHNESFKCTLASLIVVVWRKEKSYIPEDIVIKHEMYIEDASDLFGDYKMLELDAVLCHGEGALQVDICKTDE